MGVILQHGVLYGIYLVGFWKIQSEMQSSAFLPFQSRRNPDSIDWLGAYLQAALADTVLNSTRVPLMRPEAAAVWGELLGRDPGKEPPAGALEGLPVTH